ncbi:hypothetical protein B0H14DRAFT_3037163, partial [Mycena olivaceomarginata]
VLFCSPVLIPSKLCVLITSPRWLARVAQTNSNASHFVSRFRVFPRRVPPFISLCCAAVSASASHLHITSKLSPASSTSAPTRRGVIWRSFAYLLVSTPRISRMHTRTQLDNPFCFLDFAHPWTATHMTRTWPLSGSTHTRHSCVSALSHSSFTY